MNKDNINDRRFVLSSDLLKQSDKISLDRVREQVGLLSVRKTKTKRAVSHKQKHPRSVAELELAIHKIHSEIEKEKLQLKCTKWQVRILRSQVDHKKAIQRVQEENLERVQERIDIMSRSIRSLKQKTTSLKKQNQAMANYLKQYRRALRRRVDDIGSRSPGSIASVDSPSRRGTL